jgi:hypothetical protein
MEVKTEFIIASAGDATPGAAEALVLVATGGVAA